MTEYLADCCQSVRTVIISVPLAALVPGWVETTQTSFQLRDEAEAQRQAALLPMSASVSSRILPWMFSQITALETADSSDIWNATSFTQGPCNSSNLSQLPVGEFTDAISGSCSDLNQLQTQHTFACPNTGICELPSSVSATLSSTRQNLIATFSGAGFVSDFNSHDERWMR